jgi:hypothetical protein
MSYTSEAVETLEEHPHNRFEEVAIMSEPRVVQPGEGEAYVVLGSELFTAKTRGERGEGYSMFENAAREGEERKWR